MQTKISVVAARRHIATYQLHPIWRAKEELKELGYEFVDQTASKFDYSLVQTTGFGKREGKKAVEFMKKHAPIILLDDAASTGTHKMRFMHWYPDLCVGYIKKQILRNRNLYKTKYPRKRNHYYELSKIGTHLNGETKPDKTVTDKVLSRLHLGWSLALMERHGIQVLQNPLYDDRNIDIHFSIKTKYTTKMEKENLGKIDNHYAFHRVGGSLEVDRIAKKYNFSTSGFCRGSEYLRKMKQSKICISPLGLGEVCFREFEAICHGAIVIKPDMSGIETWPNIYQAYKTYIPVKWDWSDLEETVHKVVINYKRYQPIAQNAFEVIKSVWNNKVFATKFDEIFKRVMTTV
ncbi:MAG: hypothetical protein B7C24_10140 [Bacteroidetes bacterium 4572_77]|nr:MAG: hypothetical protein B7C24_10140 [Bacteroidetes bacterium 4572_77]